MLTTLYILGWFALLQLAGLSVAPVLRSVLRLPDGGAGLSKPLGLLAIGFLSWFLAILLKIPAGPGQVVISGAVVWLGARWVSKKWSPRPGAQVFAHQRAHIGTTEVIFAATFLIALLMRSFQPEIFWGEKPMDFTFLNFLTRLEDFPADDPWAAGMPMRYYYLGTYLFAALAKVSHIPTQVVYNLAMATVPAFSAAVLSSFLMYLGLRGRWVVLVCAIFLLGSTWETFSLIGTGRAINFDLFWATSRILKPAMATEYPLWSFLFADLHAHFIAIPYGLAMVAVISYLLFEKLPAKEALAVGLMGGAVAGGIASINTWDLLSLAGIAAIALLFMLAWDYRQWRSVLTTLVGAAVSAGVFLIPFFKAIGGGGAPGGFEAEGFNTVGEIVRCLGVFLIPLLLLAPLLSWAKSTDSVRSLLLRLVIVVGVLWAGLIALWMWHLMAMPMARRPYQILALGMMLIAVGAYSYLANDRRDMQWAGFALTCAGFGIAAVEMIWLNDRMNTLFKFYYPIWNLVSLAAAVMGCRGCQFVARFWRGWRREGWTRRNPDLLNGLVATVAVFLLLSSLAAGAINVQIMTTFQRISGPRPTLHGLEYLSGRDPVEYRLANFLNEKVRGVPVVLEAQGPSYQDFTRIASRTGLPTMMGWDYHVMQRGTSGQEIEARKANVAKIYQTLNPIEAMYWLKQYKVKIVIVGELERKTYPGGGLDKFAGMTQNLFPIFQEGQTVAYELR